MKIFNYQKLQKLPGRYYAPEAVMEVARLKHGKAWETNPTVKLFPAFIFDGTPSKKEFIQKNGRFSVRTKELQIARSRLEAFKKARKLFADARQVVADAIVDGRLTAQVLVGDSPETYKIDKEHYGLIVMQRLAILATGYVRLNGGLSHGIVVLKKDDIARLLNDGDPAGPAKRGQFSGSEVKSLEALAAKCRDHSQKNGAFVLTLEILTAPDVMKAIKTATLTPERSNVEISLRQYLIAVRRAFAGLLAKGGRPAKGTAINEEAFIDLLAGFESHPDRKDLLPQNPKTKMATSESSSG